MTISKGYNITGPEVESALAPHPDVEECAAVGWPHPESGQIVPPDITSRQSEFAVGRGRGARKCLALQHISV